MNNSYWNHQRILCNHNSFSTHPFVHFDTLAKLKEVIIRNEGEEKGPQELKTQEGKRFGGKKEAI